MSNSETLSLDRIGVDGELLADPLVRQAIDICREYLGQVQQDVKTNLVNAGKDPALSVLVFRSNNCLLSLDLSEELRTKGIKVKSLFNDIAYVEENTSSNIVNYTARKTHALMAIEDSNGSEVLIDPFWSQYLDRFGLSFDLAAELGDNRIFPDEFVLAFRPEEVADIADWIEIIARNFWSRVAIGNLRSKTDIFTKAKKIQSFTLRAAGVKNEPISPLTSEKIRQYVYQIWDRENYHELGKEEIEELL